jgi:hypothetical protein
VLSALSTQLGNFKKQCCFYPLTLALSLMERELTETPSYKVEFSMIIFT